MPEYLILKAYKSGRYYKPLLVALFPGGKVERTYKMFTASAVGFETKERALLEGEKALKNGKFI